MMKQEGSTNELVWVCEACEHTPAAFFCKADSASLCATCDADIHSANPLAHRHHRVPIYGHPSHDQTGRISEDGFLGDETTDEDEAASWLLLNPPAPGKNNQDFGNNNDGLLPGEEADDFLDLFEYNSGAENHYCPQFNEQKQKFSVPERSCGGDSVVPVQYGEGKHPHHIQFQNFLYDMEFNTKAEFNNSASVCHIVSVSSMDVGVVPESATMSETSMSHPRLPNGTIDLFSSPPIQVATQLSPLDREARVMRYREKKKNRKFEKTIRYASRKAYAETRPRIKGRFAKRTDVEAEVYPNGLIADSGYGIVPSF